MRLRNRLGQGTVEYALLIVAIVAVIALMMFAQANHPGAVNSVAQKVNQGVNDAQSSVTPVAGTRGTDIN